MSRAAPAMSVVVKTYEWPEALDIVLHALSEQDGPGLEVVVADDGSGPETAQVVSSWCGRFSRGVEHVWQQDEGFRLARVENLAALAATGELLVFLDGDAIPRLGFLDAVRAAALRGWFLATKRLNLGEQLSREVLAGRAPVWRWSALRWFATRPRELVAAPRAREPNRPGVLLPLRDRRRPWRRGQPEFAPPYEGYGCFLALRREDLERVNGFDMRFEGWGEEDVDIALRLRRAGLRCGWPGPRATVLHLWHPDRTRTENMPLLRETEADGRVEAVAGLRELRRELVGV